MECISHNDENNESELVAAASINELFDLEAQITNDQAFKSVAKKAIHVAGLTCRDACQHINTSIELFISTKVQVKVNVLHENNVHNKDCRDYISMRIHLPNIMALML